MKKESNRKKILLNLGINKFSVITIIFLIMIFFLVLFVRLEFSANAWTDLIGMSLLGTIFLYLRF